MSLHPSWSTSSVFPVFPTQKRPRTIAEATGPYITDVEGRRFFDLTAGGSHYAIVGWGHPQVCSAIEDQLRLFSHADYKIWNDPNVEVLASLLTAGERVLDRVYFAGNSGAEACEAAMKMSYQVHHDLGKQEKTWFISRQQSYHGSTADALALGDRPNLDFYAPMLNPKRSRIPMHHFSKCSLPGESEDEYATRCANDLEEEILRIGPERVAAFIGETIMGGLVGDVPPVGNYWKKIRSICDRYDVHLIMDEVYCGTGTTGRYHCFTRDEVVPDFVLIGKTLGAGYGPISAVITSSATLNIIESGQQRLQHTTTFQAHSLSVAAALAVQRIVSDDALLSHVDRSGRNLRTLIRDKLQGHPCFIEVRGRGLRFSIEHSVGEQVTFGEAMEQRLRDEHGLLVSCKWHRISITPALIADEDELQRAVCTVCDVFLELAGSWCDQR